MKSVRSAVARVGRECSFRLMPETEAPPLLREQLNALRERWRDGEDERGFTMELGGGVRGEDPELMLAVAFAFEGRRSASCGSRRASATRRAGRWT